MGVIYASADLTIIAASGQDSSFGLPGVSRERMASVKHEDLGSMILVSCQTDAIHSIYNSVWTTRGWTFQEGYLSKRRIYFTDNQLVYICNGQVRTEAIGQRDLYRHDLGNLGDSLPSYRSIFHHKSERGLLSAMSNLEEYTNRSLSYESDALNAIAGAQNTLLKVYDINHLWGIPFSTAGVVALYWFHLKPVPRRSGIPSWSPLGWQGPVKFVGTGKQPMITKELELRVCIDEKYQSLSNFQADRDNCDRLVNATQYMKVTAPIIPVSLFNVQGTNERSGLQNGLHVVFNWSDQSNIESKSWELYVQPWWDLWPLDEEAHKSTVCMFFETGRSLGGIICWLLCKYGEHYQRIGCLMYPGGSSKDPCQALVKDEHGVFVRMDDTCSFLTQPIGYKALWRETAQTKVSILC
jgi:hypothetical protein